MSHSPVPPPLPGRGSSGNRPQPLGPVPLDTPAKQREGIPPRPGVERPHATASSRLTANPSQGRAPENRPPLDRAPLHDLFADDGEPLKSNRKRNTILIVTGLAALVAMTGLLLSMGNVSTQPMPGGDTQKREHAKATFRNLDAETDLHQLSIDNVSRVRAGGSDLQALGDFKMFRVRGREKEWVFVYQRDGLKNALQGVPMDNDQEPNALTIHQQLDASIKQSEAYPVAEVQSTATTPQWLDWSVTVHKRETHISFEQVVSPYVDVLRNTSWRHAITFVMMPTKGDLYVAAVPHPVDDASRARASAFIDDAITRPRTIHHAPAICALMLAINPPAAPQAWLHWLEATTNTPEEKLILESDPAQEEPGRGVLKLRARQVQALTAQTLAVLSDYQKVDASITWLTAEPVAQTSILIRLAAGREFVGTPGHRRDEVLAKMPAHAQPYFKVAQSPRDAFEDPIIDRLKFLESSEPSEPKFRSTLVALNNAFITADNLRYRRPDLHILQPRTTSVIMKYLGKDVTKVPEPGLWMSRLAKLDPKQCRHLLLDYIRQRNDANATQTSWVTTTIDRIAFMGLGEPSEFSREFDMVQQLALDRTNPIREEDFDKLVSALDRWSRGDSQVQQRYRKALSEHMAAKAGHPASPTTPTKPPSFVRPPAPTVPASPAAMKSNVQRLLATRNSTALEELKKIFEDGFDYRTLDSPGDDRIAGSSALHMAVAARNMQAVELLVERGADIHLSVRHRRTVLNEAVFNSDIDIATFLLAKGAKCSTEPAPTSTSRIRTKDMPTLSIAAMTGSVPMMELLLRHGADVNACEKPGELPPRTPLDEALTQMNDAASSFLLARDGKVVASHEQANFLLRKVLRQPDGSVGPLLLKSGMKLDNKGPADDLLRIPIYLKNGADLAESLLAAGTPIYLQTYDAIAKDPNRASLAAVVRKHSQARAKETGRDPVALYDAMKSSPATLRKLIDEQADVNAPIDDGNTTLLALAVATGQPSFMKLLISKGADPNKTPGFNPYESLLVSAINSRNSDVVKTLLDGGADLNFKHTPAQPSPLFKAIQTRQHDIIKLLLDRGADPDAPVMPRQIGDQRSAFETALLGSDNDIIEQLATSKALPGKEAAKVRRQFLAAVAGGRTLEMNSLVKAGFDVGKVDQQLNLITVSISNRVPVKAIEHLIKLGAPVAVDDLLHSRFHRRTDLETMIAEAGTKSKDAQMAIAFAWLDKVKQGPSAIQKGIADGTDATKYVDSRGWTLLHMAVFAGNVESVRYLRQIGVMDRPDQYGRPASSLVMMNQNPQLHHQLMQALHTQPSR